MARLVPPWGDVVLAGVFVAGTAAEALTSDATGSRLAHVLFGVPGMAALAWRRRFPMTVAVVVMGSNIAINPDGEFSTLLALVLVSFTLGAELESPRDRIGLALVAVPFLTALSLEGLVPSDVAAALVFLGGPWAVGVAVRERTARTTEALDRAAQLEQERDANREAAAAQERVRIARELHDIVSHSISVVAIQTQAVRYRLGPEHAREARILEEVETTAREALAEMRRLFGVLRSDGEAALLTPQPGLVELDRLLRQVRTAGLPVELQVEGEQTVLPPGIDLAAYRIIQEGLTNALRHAAAQHARICLRYLPSAVEIEVEDDGRGPPGSEGRRGGGHGLVGIRERVALYGGTVEFGPAPGGGSRLLAHLPVSGRR